MVRRSWKSLLSSAALLSAFSVAGIAAAGDGCSEGCTTAGCPDCKSCEQVFNDAGQKLTDQLAKMSACGDGCGNNANCSAPQSVCDSGAADPCGDPLGDACAEGCDGGLFGESGSGIEFGGWTQFGYQNNPDGSFTGNGVTLNQKDRKSTRLNSSH